MSDDIADGQHGGAVAEPEGIEPVTADLGPLPRRHIPRGEFQVLDSRQVGEERQLQLLGRAQLDGVQPGVLDRESCPVAQVGREEVSSSPKGSVDAVRMRLSAPKTSLRTWSGTMSTPVASSAR